MLVPLLLFVLVYVATLAALVWLRFPSFYWAGLVSAIAASAVTIAFSERGRWDLGFFIAPKVAARDLFAGAALGVLLVGSTAMLVVLLTDVHHVRGRGMPWRELALVYAPAVVHEELLFRGYPFQKLYRRSRIFALLFVALVFAALHAGNTAVTPLALANIFLGGLLLGVAWERTRNLWFPIGVHFAWNALTGPILGHEVSGYESLQTLFVERGGGPGWLTGGDFGIEGSVVMTALEVVGIVLLARSGVPGAGDQGPDGSTSSGTGTHPVPVPGPRI